MPRKSRARTLSLQPPCVPGVLLSTLNGAVRGSLPRVDRSAPWLHLSSTAAAGAPANTRQGCTVYRADETGLEWGFDLAPAPEGLRLALAGSLSGRAPAPAPRLSHCR